MPPLGLALVLTRHDTVEAAIHAYEKTMPPRSTEMARLLDGAAEHLLSTRLPDFTGNGTR